jgi:hypothetical protein
MATYSAYSNIDSALTWTVGEKLIRSGNTIGWYDITDIATITKDGDGLVSVWADKLGSGNDLIQADGAKQPLYSANGILFNGSDEFLKTGTIATLVKPETVYIVFKQVTWANGDRIFDGRTRTSGQLYQDK